MSINQLNDDGAVIGYKPTLQYIKENNTEAKAEDSNSSATDYSGNVDYTETINSFSNNLPSTSLSNIDYTLENIKTLIDNLASSFEKGDWNQYGEISSLLSAVESNNKEYITNFIEYHKDDITKSIIPELIGYLYDTKYTLEILNNVLKELYYGDSTILTEDCKEIDNAYLEKLKAYEAGDDMSKINYLALSYDSILNRSVSMYSFSVNGQAIDIADIVRFTEESAVSPSKASLVKKMFDEVNEEIDYRKGSYNPQQSVEIMEKTLYNYYSKRRETMDLYELYNDNKDSIFIGTKVQDYQEQINDALTNINRVFLGNQYYLSEIVKLEREKYYLKNIYANFNYNLEN